MSIPAIKICGLTRPADAKEAQSAGAFFGGVILAPGSPRTVDNSLARKVFADTELHRCGVFVNQSIDELEAAVREIDLDVIQLHGDEDLSFIDHLRARLDTRIWKALRIRNADDFLHGIERFSPLVDGILLDSWSDTARGGTGISFPWESVRNERNRVPSTIKLAVAGGLNPENVGELIEQLAPDVVDVSSGVESAPRIKDTARMRAFVSAVRQAETRESAG